MIAARHDKLGEYFLHCASAKELLFTENESNQKRLSGAVNPTPFVKDAFHEYVIAGIKEAVNPEKKGTEVCGALRGGGCRGRPGGSGAEALAK